MKLGQNIFPMISWMSLKMVLVALKTWPPGGGAFFLIWLFIYGPYMVIYGFSKTV
jgi:hypothetical protein